jgi:hypothetical protein
MKVYEIAARSEVCAACERDGIMRWAAVRVLQGEDVQELCEEHAQEPTVKAARRATRMRNLRARIRRFALSEAMDSIGMRRVRGAVSGATYWE